MSENYHPRSQLLLRSRQKRQRPSGSYDAWRTLEKMENGVGYVGKENEQQVSVKEEKLVKQNNYDLRPCHICHRKPSAKRELNEYGDCEGCEQRTCYVCIRQCDGLGMWSDKRKLYEDMYGDGGHEKLLEGKQGEKDSKARKEKWKVDDMMAHKEKVCSRCCVERGADGDVWCMGCLRSEEAG
jgi:hypothetical protein